jgi:hypothetical protein
MGRASTSRNSPCPCGSGRKYKRCCLAAQENVAREARLDDAVGRRIEDWSSEVFGAEMGAALDEFGVNQDRVMGDDDVQILATWFHNDRELAGGGTPAERYAARGDLSDTERTAAARIAGARLGLHRVLEVKPGSWLVLEDVLSGARVRVRSQNVSRDAVRWDVLMGRVMDGDPPSLWGPTRFFEPCDEPELLGELERLAGMDGADADEHAMWAALREHAHRLLRFTPERLSAEPSFFTLEGDPVAFCSATWAVHDLPAAGERLRALGGLGPQEAIEIDMTAPRGTLVADRPPLPLGAIVLEAGTADGMDTVPVATLRLERAELRAEVISEQRLERAIEAVDRHLEGLVDLIDVEVTSVEETLAERRSAPKEATAATPGLHPADERRLLDGFKADRMRLWLDEPHAQLDGQTPREAAAGEREADVVRLVRGLENSAERASRRGQPATDVAWIRSELGLEQTLVA